LEENFRELHVICEVLCFLVCDDDDDDDVLMGEASKE
jgi:hypothetical protein